MSTSVRCRFHHHLHFMFIMLVDDSTHQAKSKRVAGKWWITHIPLRNWVSTFSIVGSRAPVKYKDTFWYLVDCVIQFLPLKGFVWFFKNPSWEFSTQDFYYSFWKYSKKTVEINQSTQQCVSNRFSDLVTTFYFNTKIKVFFIIHQFRGYF